MRPRRAPIAILAAAALALTAATPAAAATYSNLSPIAVPDGDASPYPSEIAVSGATGVITDVNVDLYTINHTYLYDVGAVLVAPSGSALLLVEGAADGPATDLGLRFDDEAPTRVPGGTRPATGGIFKPTANSSFMAPFPFPAPGPGTSYGHPGPAIGGTATLSSAFDGQAANGIWRLFVRDFAPTDTGSVDNGWALDIETTAPQPEPAAPRKRKCKKKKKKRSAGAAAKRKCKQGRPGK